MKYFVADYHFGSEDMLIREHRPFKTAREYDKYVLDILNKQLDENDTLYCIGDWCNCDNADRESWKQTLFYPKLLNCSVVLLYGNNEYRITRQHFNSNFEEFRQFAINQCGFIDVQMSMRLTLGNTSCYLNHYPSRHKKHYLNLFGHTHKSTGLYKPFGLNVGCDLNFFRPYS